MSWFVQKSHAQTTPSLRSSSGADLKVKLMLDGRTLNACAKEFIIFPDNCVFHKGNDGFVLHYQKQNKRLKSYLSESYDTLTGLSIDLLLTDT